MEEMVCGKGVWGDPRAHGESVISACFYKTPSLSPKVILSKSYQPLEITLSQRELDWRLTARGQNPGQEQPCNQGIQQNKGRKWAKAWPGPK